MAGLHWLISRKEIHARWGDVSSGAAFERARRALLRLEEENYHPKNWRPIILAHQRRRLPAQPPRRVRLLAHRRPRRAHPRPDHHRRRRGPDRAPRATPRTSCASSSPPRNSRPSPPWSSTGPPGRREGPAPVPRPRRLQAEHRHARLVGEPRRHPAPTAACSASSRDLGRSLVIVRCDREEQRIRWSAPTGTDRHLVARRRQQLADAAARPPARPEPRLAPPHDPHPPRRRPGLR